MSLEIIRKKDPSPEIRCKGTTKIAHMQIKSSFFYVQGIFIP